MTSSCYLAPNLIADLVDGWPDAMLPLRVHSHSQLNIFNKLTSTRTLSHRFTNSFRSTRSYHQPHDHLLDMNQEENILPPPIDTGKRLEGVKQLMKTNQVSIYVVPTEDAHGSEYICPADARREYITGFTGSAGTALILLNQPQSLLFTDGRYFNQASKQLHPSYWTLMKQGLEGVPTWQEYLIKAAADHLDNTEAQNPTGLRIGIDPTLFSVKDSHDLSAKLQEHSAQLVSLKDNLIDIEWASSRSERPHNPIRILELKYSGQSTSEKLEKIWDRLKSLNESRRNLIGIVVSALDEIAWCLNLRGSDIVYNPVFFSYLWIGIQDQVILFVNEHQLDSTLSQYLRENHIETRPYDSIWNFLQEFHDSKLNPSSPSAIPHGKVLISPTTSLAIENHLGGESKTVQLRSPLQDLKAIKNSTEIEGFRNAHLRDGVALVTYFAWLEETLLAPGARPLNEYDAALELERFRKQLGGDFFQGLSFDTISSSGKNAAIIHYGPPETGSAIIDKDQIYLCDSGAQYLDGTTDVTRTWHFGAPTAEEKRACTRVLQGHINIDQMIFPEKTTGYQLDPFARQYLWLDGLDYRHGTGHGVGHFLNVHEGPQGIGTRPQCDQVSLKAGMTLSNEPGYYKDEGFGIRIESVVVVKEIKRLSPEPPNENNTKPFLGFENLTMCPIQTKLLDLSLLNQNQVEWINSYHQLVLDKLSPRLTHDSRALNWLKKECQPIPTN
ncbi:hypothetical protein PGT21_023200 [Puccinia graminis f. sp. tritici]|uniref:Uncharacterized protein n=1 Tax=Puccinia graminis f. sp. tritici TaxID=56615 RepID=A0A5B0NSS5_PUCGR|nr:hypothetical protein PGT21_023200 [Puccinia graminis f. sp. tritici]KAA1092327.1 hypothetical protein PGTUg99_020381 [Puccinia graminis f. sp. tritici]